MENQHLTSLILGCLFYSSLIISQEHLCLAKYPWDLNKIIIVIFI